MGFMLYQGGCIVVDVILDLRELGPDFLLLRLNLLEGLRFFLFMGGDIFAC